MQRRSTRRAENAAHRLHKPPDRSKFRHCIGSHGVALAYWLRRSLAAYSIVCVCVRARKAKRDYLSHKNKLMLNALIKLTCFPYFSLSSHFSFFRSLCFCVSLFVSIDFTTTTVGRLIVWHVNEKFTSDVRIKRMKRAIRGKCTSLSCRRIFRFVFHLLNNYHSDMLFRLRWIIHNGNRAAQSIKSLLI